MANRDTTSIPEKRRAKRIPAPVGTTALIKNSAGSLDTVYVRDISVAGLLVYGYISGERYPVSTLINGFLIDIPPCELTANSRVYLLVNGGKVVRAFFDQVSKTFCYGIELINQSSYAKERLESLVSKIQPDLRH